MILTGRGASNMAVSLGFRFDIINIIANIRKNPPIIYPRVISSCSIIAPNTITPIGSIKSIIDIFDDSNLEVENIINPNGTIFPSIPKPNPQMTF